MKGSIRLVDAGRKNERVYYTRDNAAWWTDIESGETHKIAQLPRRGSMLSINADETLLAGTFIEGDGMDYNNRKTPHLMRLLPQTPRPEAAQGHSLDQPRNKGQMMEQRLAARLPMGMFMIDTQTGEVKKFTMRRNGWITWSFHPPIPRC